MPKKSLYSSVSCFVCYTVFFTNDKMANRLSKSRALYKPISCSKAGISWK